MNYNEKLKELTEKFILEMESLKSKNQLLKIEKEKDSARYEETFKLSEDKHNQVKWDPKWTILTQPGTKADGPNLDLIAVHLWFEAAKPTIFV